MKITMLPLSSLTATEVDQCEVKIAAIMAAYGSDESEIDWSEQPAIIANESGEILDGHHRAEAFSRLGYTLVRVLVVDADFANLADQIGLQGAVREAADELGCAYTWAAA